MSDHESEVSLTGTGPESEAIAPFSTNGSDHGGTAIAGEYRSIDHVDDGATFMADLAQAMQTTAAAEQARNAEGTEQRRQAYIDAIRAREALDAEELRELAKEDVKGIDAWSDGEIKRVKLERERRIASRREQLQIRLEEHRSVVAREVEAVEAAIASYRSEIESYFQRLESETDPVAIARYAGSRPPFPVLELIGPDDAPAVYAYPAISSQAISSQAISSQPIAVEAPAVEAPAVEAPAVDVPTSHDEGPADGSGDASAADGPLVGVMEPEAGTHEPANPWEHSSDAVAVHEADDAQPVNEETEAADPSDGSEEPVAALVEARVVMPRTTGAGSWLRWPNTPVDRSDPSR